MTCLTLRVPAHLSQRLEGVEGVRFIKRAAAANVVLAFCAGRRDLAPLVERALSSIMSGGMIWVAWPKKKSSPLYKVLTEQDFRDHILPTGWVDVKVCAIDADWSGLRLLKRKA